MAMMKNVTSPPGKSPPPRRKEKGCAFLAVLGCVLGLDEARFHAPHFGLAAGGSKLLALTVIDVKKYQHTTKEIISSPITIVVNIDRIHAGDEEERSHRE